MSTYSHSFSIVEEPGDGRDTFIVETIKRGISEGCTIIIILPSEESSPNTMVNSLAKKGLQDVWSYIDRGLLAILDRDFENSGSHPKLWAKGLLERYSSFEADDTIVDKSNCHCILAISTTKVFSDTNAKNSFEKLRIHERQIEKRFIDIPVESIHCFDAQSFAKLSLKDIINILDFYEYVVYQGGIYTYWHKSMILELMNKALDRVLGPGSANLVLKTLKLVYKLDAADIIVSRPELFEGKLQKLLGVAANEVLDAIKREVTSELLYLHNSENNGDNDDKHSTNMRLLK